MTKVLLMILDGWGIGGGAADPADAISAAHPAFIESLAALMASAGSAATPPMPQPSRIMIRTFVIS